VTLPVNGGGEEKKGEEGCGYTGVYSEAFWNVAVSIAVRELLPSSWSSAHILSWSGLEEGQTECR
jgi:hypothetical protein